MVSNFSFSLKGYLECYRRAMRNCTIDYIAVLYTLVRSAWSFLVRVGGQNNERFLRF